MDALLTLDPNLIYLLLVFGLWAGVTASYLPGTGVAELLTVGSLGVSAIYLWQNPGTNWWALLLLCTGVLSFITFPFLPPRWREFTLAGLALQALGSWFLFEEYTINPILLIAILGLQLLYHRALLIPVLERARLMKSEASRDEKLIGQQGRMTSALDPFASNPLASVLVKGESWTASSDYPLQEGEMVAVVERRGLQLQVEPLEKTDKKKIGVS